MYAILSHGGRQYRVSAGDRLLVDRLAAEVGSVVALEPLLLTAGVAVLGFALTLILPEPAGRSLEDMPTSARDTQARPLRLASQPTEDPASAA